MSPASASEERLARIARILADRPALIAERDPPFKESAVALILHPAADGLETLLIKRANRDGDPWSGQMALPGGRREGDESLDRTARRETLEEVGFDLDAHGTLLGTLDELRPRIAVLPPMIVRPHVYSITQRRPLVPNSEVAETLWVPLAHLFDPANVRDITVQARGMTFNRRAIGVGEHNVWGLTEGILRYLEDIWR